MTAKVYLFEGERLTLAQIRPRAPILGDGAIRRRLALGCDTRQKLLAWDEAAARSRAGRIGRAAAEAKGKLQGSTTTWRGARARAASSGFVKARS